MFHSPVDAYRPAFVHVHPAQCDRDHRPEHQRVADDPHDVAPHVEVGDIRRAPGAVGGEVSGEQVVSRTGERQRGEGVDRYGHEQVEELQGGVEAIGVGIAPEDWRQDRHPTTENARCSALWTLSCSSVRLYQLVRWLTGMITA